MVARPPLLVPLLALAGLVALLAGVLVGWVPLEGTDHAVNEAFRGYGDTRQGFVEALRVATDVAATTPFLIVGLVTTLALLGRRLRTAAVFCAVVTAAVPTLWSLGHWLLPHPRPVDGYVTVHSNGFPSGHTTNAAAAALTAVLLLWPRLTRRGRALAVLVAAAFAVSVGLTRLALLAHWPTDVLGGWLLALVVVPLAAYAVPRPSRPAAEDPVCETARMQKLVRDRIPAIIRAEGGEPSVRIATDDEIDDLLRAKLLEEVGEFLDSGDPGDPVELADVLEVVRALAERCGVDPDVLERLRAEKAAARGGFAARVVWTVPTDAE